MLVFNGQANEFMDDVRNALKKGALYYYYLSSAPTKSITSYMYPFTPVEINSGYMVGKERILTIYSGSYGISKENYPYTALVFDQYGKQIKNYPYKNVKTSDGVKCQIKLTKGLCAVLIKNIK
jgi:hypothetical protein